MILECSGDILFAPNLDTDDVLGKKAPPHLCSFTAYRKIKERGRKEILWLVLLSKVMLTPLRQQP